MNYNEQVECIVQCLWTHSAADQDGQTTYKKGDKIKLDRFTAEALQQAGIVKMK